MEAPNEARKPSVTSEGRNQDWDDFEFPMKSKHTMRTEQSKRLFMVGLSFSGMRLASGHFKAKSPLRFLTEEEE